MVASKLILLPTHASTHTISLARLCCGRRDVGQWERRRAKRGADRRCDTVRPGRAHHRCGRIDRTIETCTQSRAQKIQSPPTHDDTMEETTNRTDTFANWELGLTKNHPPDPKSPRPFACTHRHAPSTLCHQNICRYDRGEARLTAYLPDRQSPRWRRPYKTHHRDTSRTAAPSHSYTNRPDSSQRTQTDPATQSHPMRTASRRSRSSCPATG